MNSLHKYSLTLLIALLGTLSSCSDDANSMDINTTVLDVPQDSVIVDTTSEPLDDADSLFNPDSIFTFEVTLDSTKWKELQINALDEEYTSVKFIRGRDTLQNVGMRFKGAYGSLKFCVKADGTLEAHCPKLSMKFKFSEYETEQRYMGLKRLNFHAMMNDASKLNDKLGYKLYREMDIQSPRSSHANLIINGKNMGVYALVEQIDGRFTSSRWDQGDGNLYKEVWPKHSTPSAYIEKLKTNEEVADVSGMIHFDSTVKQAFINSDKELFEELTPIDNAINFLVVDLAIQNVDGYRTFYCWGGSGKYSSCNPHNFYWYQHETKDRFELIPWDLDASFSLTPFITGMPEWNDLSVSCDEAIQNTVDRTLWHPGCDPYFRMLAVHYEKEYKEAIQNFLDGPFNISKVHSDIDKWVKTMEPHMENDPHVDLISWMSAVEKLKANINVLYSQMEDRMNGKAPENFGLKTNTANNYEDWSTETVNAFIPYNTNANTIFKTEINTVSPLEGNQDVKLSFNYQNTGTSAYSQWGSWRFNFENNKLTDLTGLKAIKLKVRADKQSVLKIELGSLRYANPNSGKQYGWTEVIDIDAVDLTLNVEEIGYAWSGQDPIANGEPTVEEILTDLQSLVIYPEQFGRVDGIYPEGKGYEGTFYIDDIQFVF